MKDVSRSTLLSMQLDGHFLSTYYGEHAAREQTEGWRGEAEAGRQSREEQHCRLKRSGVAVRTECHTGPEQTQSLVSPSRSSTSWMGGEQREAGERSCFRTEGSSGQEPPDHWQAGFRLLMWTTAVQSHQGLKD